MTALIAHRGRGWEYPENTMPAFRAALEGGADGIECDFRLGLDGALFIYHNKEVRDRPVEELSQDSRHSLEIPLIKEVLDLEAEYPGKLFLMEAKTLAAGEKFLREVDPRPGMVIISFLDEVITSAKKEGWETVLLETASREVLLDRLPSGARLGPSTALAWQLRREELQRSYIWTVNNLQEGEYFQEQQAWAIGTDFVRQLRSVY